MESSLLIDSGLIVILRWTVGTILFATLLLEWRLAARRQLRIYSTRETLSNFVILAVGQLMRAIGLAYHALWLGWASQLAPFQLPTTIGVFLFSFLAVDFAYYWHHRALHRFEFLWSLHEVHHSSPWFNLTTSFRLNWLGPFILGPLFVPLVFLGLPPQFVLLSLAVNLLFQFFLHSPVFEFNPTLEGFINTPSAHRVHHGKNPAYIDKNFGGILMVWDRLFGTYQKESEPVDYGIEQGFLGHHPVRVMFHGLGNWWQSTRRRVLTEKGR